MPIRLGRYSWAITIVTPKVLITEIPTPASAIAPTAPPTATNTRISGAVTAVLTSSTGRRPNRSASGPAANVPSPPASSISERRWFPCAFEWPSETSQSGTNVISPNQEMLRKAITPSRRMSAPTRSGSPDARRRPASVANEPRNGASRNSATATTRHGTASSSPPSSPKASTSGVATVGPRAKPRFPPIENSDIALARRRPPTNAANFDPSG